MDFQKVRYSLRTFLVLSTFMGAGIGLFCVNARQASRQQAAVQKLNQFGVYVYYDYECDRYGYPIAPSPLQIDDLRIEQRPSPLPRWLERLVGRDFFFDVVHVDCRDAVNFTEDLDFRYLADGELACLRHFPNLKYLDVETAVLNEKSLKRIESLPDLKQFYRPNPLKIETTKPNQNETREIE